MFEKTTTKQQHYSAHVKTKFKLFEKIDMNMHFADTSTKVVYDVLNYWYGWTQRFTTFYNTSNKKSTCRDIQNISSL